MQDSELGNTPAQHIECGQAEPLQVPAWLWKIVQSRGVNNPDELDYQLSRLIRPDGLKGLDAACTLIINTLENDEPIVIAGDYDVDGATGTALAVKVLTAFGSSCTSYHLPNRFEQGYGLSPDVVEQLHEQGCSLLITVDNGITSYQAIATAKALGVRTIITDHHLPEHDLPDADAIINPNQPGCTFATKNLAGVGVIFYLLSAVRSRLREKHWFLFRKIREPVMSNFLDLVALGTIADMAPLDYNNRVLVTAGLRRIQQGKASPGIRSLLHQAGVKLTHCSSRDIGFSLAPPLNAAGRLDSMEKGIACILAHTWNKAWPLAEDLVRINNERKKLQAKMVAGVEHAIIKTYGHDNIPDLLILHNADWHQGITGVVAGNVKDSQKKSCIILSSTEGGVLKGSGRATSALHLRDLLMYIDVQYPDVFIACGGHAAAAGMSLHQDKLDDLRRYANKHYQQFLIEGAEEETHDGSLESNLLTMDTARLLEKMGPWGQGFAEPEFYDRFTLGQQSVIAERHLRFTVMRDGTSLPAIAFNIDRKLWPNRTVNDVDIRYNLHINRFQGKETLQLTVSRIQPVLDGG